MLGGDQSETMEDDRSLGPGDPQSPTLQPRSMISNSPQSLHSAFAESLSLIESGSSTECPPDKSLRRRLKHAVGLSRNSSEYTLKCHVPEITRSGNMSEYHGYGRVAAYEDSDPSFLIYRKFGWVHNRILLHLQDELVDLEGQLEDLDKWEALTGNPTKLVCRRLDDAGPEESERRILLRRCSEKLAEYDEILLRLQKKQAMQRPTKRNQNSLYNLIDTSDSLLQSESQWIRQSDDLVALACDADYGYFNSFLELSLRRLSKKLILAIFRTPEQKIKTGSDEHLTLISAERFDVLLRVVITVFAAILLLLPVLILWELQPTEQSQAKHAGRFQLLTIFLFTMGFSASCSIFTKAKRQEVFAATAAYCAVLVVFLGNSSNVMAFPSNG